MIRGAVELMEIHLLLMNHVFRDDQRPQCPNDSISVMIFLYIISRQTKSFSVLNTDNICVVGCWYIFQGLARLSGHWGSAQRSVVVQAVKVCAGALLPQDFFSLAVFSAI